MIGWLAQTWGIGVNTANIENLETPEPEYSTQVVSRHFANTANRTLGDIVIEGDSNFVSHVNNCLAELKNTQYESLVSVLRKIKQVSTYAESGVSSGVYKVAPDTMGLGYGTWGGDDCIYGAATLIHEAVHTEREFSGTFDNTNYAGEEILANIPRAEFLRSHGRHADAAYIESLDGRHNEPYMSPEFLAMQR